MASFNCDMGYSSICGAMFLRALTEQLTAVAGEPVGEPVMDLAPPISRLHSA